MRIDVDGLRTSILAALGVIGATGCGGLVVFVEDGGDGGQGGAGGGLPSTVVSGSTSTSAAGGAAPTSCENPEPLFGPDGSSTGYVRCADGSIDRASIGQCAFDWDPPPCLGNEDVIDCLSDADCGGTGQCGHSEAIRGGTFCQCFYGCETDQDCGSPDLACVCGGMLPTLPGSMCVPKTCDTDADCPEGECGLGTYDDGCERYAFLGCRSQPDVCRVDSDCVAAGLDGECSPPFAGASFQCVPPGCAVGRPLLVDGQSRTAPRAARAGWAIDAASLAGFGDARERALAAAHYRALAALEHASVASFSRFALQLMAHGAPAELLAQTHAAALDEVRHAQLAYGLAARFGGAAEGPGPLPEAVAPIALELPAIVEALVLEACVGETLGAAEAALAAHGAASPVLAQALLGVADDEQRHAELGWRALAWFLKHDASLVAVAQAAFERAQSSELFDSSATYPAAKALGVADSRAVAETRRATFDGVIQPCAAALFAACRMPS